jgi:hypothetical protein
MANSGQSFREFEQAGWEDWRVVAKYHEHLVMSVHLLHGFERVNLQN